MMQFASIAILCASAHALGAQADPARDLARDALRRAETDAHLVPAAMRQDADRAVDFVASMNVMRRVVRSTNAVTAVSREAFQSREAARGEVLDCSATTSACRFRTRTVLLTISRASLNPTGDTLSVVVSSIWPRDGNDRASDADLPMFLGGAGRELIYVRGQDGVMRLDRSGVLIIN